MNKKEFSELFQVGDFIWYNNLICHVDSFKEVPLAYFRSEKELAYQVTPVFAVRYLRERTFNVFEEDVIDTFSQDGRVVSENELLEAMILNMDTIENIGENTCYFSDTEVTLSNNDGYMILSPKEAIKLRDLINNYVGER